MGHRPPTDPQWWEWSSFFQATNTNKRDVTLDMTHEAGRALARRLVGECDVVVENYSPRVMDSWGLGWDDVRALRPDVIIVRMPAFGLDGPWRDRGGFAMTVEQISGMAWLTGFADDGPVVPRGACDVLAGLHAIVALLGALEHRRLTGEGLLVEVPMAEAALNVAAEQTIEWTANDVLLSRNGNRSFQAAPQGVYACGDTEETDHYLVLSVESDAQWRHPCRRRSATRAGRSRIASPPQRDATRPRRDRPCPGRVVRPADVRRDHRAPVVSRRSRRRGDPPGPSSCTSSSFRRGGSSRPSTAR